LNALNDCNHRVFSRFAAAPSSSESSFANADLRDGALLTFVALKTLVLLPFVVIVAAVVVVVVVVVAADDNLVVLPVAYFRVHCLAVS
jgi:hypothetical protein